MNGTIEHQIIVSLKQWAQTKSFLVLFLWRVWVCFVYFPRIFFVRCFFCILENSGEWQNQQKTQHGLPLLPYIRLTYIFLLYLLFSTFCSGGEVNFISRTTPRDLK
eukprot:GEMP01108382.1.p1 GENE.GEMP01108382.1~~GEMP01108382.1.p1  ORF type:complete len:106 (+),score=0.73 GEMP01108382.1:97-414(+)